MTLPWLHSVVSQAGPPPETLARTLELIDLGRLSAALAIVVFAYLLHRGVEVGLDRLAEDAPRRRLTLKKASSFARLAIVIVGGYLVVTTLLDGQESAMLGVLGTLAVAVGFALKDTLSSVMAGVMILIDQPFQVGDRIRFGEVYGEVTEIGLRSVRVRTPSDDTVSIPNNKFSSQAVASANAGTLQMMVPVQFFIGDTEDFQLAKQLIYRASATSRYVYLGRPIAIDVEERATDTAFALVLTCRAYVIDTRFEKDYVTDVTERVKAAFAARAINPPHAREFLVAQPGGEGAR